MSDFLWKRLPHLPWRVVLVLSVAVSPLAGGAKLAAVPSSPTTDHAVIPGFERFFTGPQADAVGGGQLLLGELNCISCHKPDAQQEAFLLRKQAPLLDGVGSRVRRSFLRKFLSDPQSVKPGTTMPNLLADLPEAEREQKLEQLVHLLASTGALRQERTEPKLIPNGREVYHRIGCVACHGTRDAAGNPAQLLPTSVPLGDLKAKYSLGSLKAFLENPHLVRPSGRMPGLLAAKEAKEVANYLLQGLPYEAPAPNMNYAYYEGDWDKLPDFDKLKARASGKASGFDLSLAHRSNNFALRFEGFLRIDREGDYRFHLTSDDGSKLFLDGKLAVANDGVHAPTTIAGTVKLTKGMHKLVAGVFNGPGGVELNVEIEGPGLGRQPASPLVFLTPEGNPAPKVPDRVVKADEENFPIDPALAEKGRVTFVALGCASCHPLNLTAKLASPTPSPLAKLKPGAGCLAAPPAKGVPHYALSAAQRTALAAAITSLAVSPANRPVPSDVIARTMTTFNCYACHQRDKVGGVEEGLNASFTTTQPEMGDEGRLPPSLTGVGAKLTRDWLKKVLANGAHDRPYMHTQMPRFGEQNTAQLVQALETVDTLEPVQKPAFTKLARVKSDGRHMVGGMCLGCIKCHTFAGHKAEGVQGIDMTLMTQRLQHDWFHRYVTDPQKFRPGTRMPSAWPNSTSPLPDIQGGDAARQIEAIWVYLADGGRALLPQGLNKVSIPLVPEKEAIIYRNFLEGAGPRAIGVGYPEKAHLAFDANEMRLAMIWQGAFMDASRHWTDRGAGYEPPLGDNILHLPTGVSFAVLAKDGEPWPGKSAKELGYKFRGYRLSPDERPTFFYSWNGVRVEDFPNAIAGKASPSIKRTLTLTAEQPVPNLWFRAAVGDKIEAVGDGSYQVNGEWRMRIEGTAPPRIREAGGKKELLVPVRFNEGRARIIQEFVW